MSERQPIRESRIENYDNVVWKHYISKKTGEIVARHIYEVDPITGKKKHVGSDEYLQDWGYEPKHRYIPKQYRKAPTQNLEPLVKNAQIEGFSDKFVSIISVIAASAIESASEESDRETAYDNIKAALQNATKLYSSGNLDEAMAQARLAHKACRTISDEGALGSEAVIDPKINPKELEEAIMTALVDMLGNGYIEANQSLEAAIAACEGRAPSIELPKARKKSGIFKRWNKEQLQEIDVKPAEVTVVQPDPENFTNEAILNRRGRARSWRRGALKLAMAAAGVAVFIGGSSPKEVAHPLKAAAPIVSIQPKAENSPQLSTTPLVKNLPTPNEIPVIKDVPVPEVATQTEVLRTESLTQGGTIWDLGKDTLRRAMDGNDPTNAQILEWCQRTMELKENKADIQGEWGNVWDGAKHLRDGFKLQVSETETLRIALESNTKKHP